MMHQSMNLNAVQAIYQFNFSEIRKNWYAVYTEEMCSQITQKGNMF